MKRKKISSDGILDESIRQYDVFMEEKALEIKEIDDNIYDYSKELKDLLELKAHKE